MSGQPPPALPAASQRLETASEVTWKNFKDVVKGEAKYVCEDYKTMEQMNEHVIVRLHETGERCTVVGNELQSLNSKMADLEAYLKEIDVISERVNEMESVAAGLDTYTRNLETKYKSLLKQQ